MNGFKSAFIVVLTSTFTILPSDRSKPAQAAGAGALAKNPQATQPLISLTQAHTRLDPNTIKEHIKDVNYKIQYEGSKPQLSVWHPRPAHQFFMSVNCVAWSPKGELFATGSRYNARIWDTQGNLKHTLDHTCDIKALAWSHDGESIATAAAGVDPAVCIWDAQTGAKKAILGHPEVVSSIRWSKNNQWLVTCSDNHAYIWKVNQPENKITVKINDSTPPVLLSPDCKSVAIGAKDNMVHVYDLESGELKATLKHPWHIKRIAWNPSSDSLCVSCQGNFADFLYHWSLNPVAFKDYIKNDHYHYSIAWDNEGKPTAMPQRTPVPFNANLLQQMKGPDNAQLHWSPNRMHAITVKGDYAQLWDTAHLRDPQFLEQYSLLNAHRLTPAQTMLLVLLSTYSLTSHEFMKLRRTPSPCPILADIVERAQERDVYKGLTVSECADALRTFHLTLRQMIINAYDIQDAHHILGISEYAQAEKALFDRDAPVLSDGPGKPEGPVQTQIREFIMGTTPTKERIEEPLTEEEKILENIEARIDAAVKLAQGYEQTKAQDTKALFEAIKNCDEKEVKKRLNHVTVVARHPHLHHRTPLMEVIWQSEKKYNDYNKIFDLLLQFKKFYRFDRYNYEERTSQLDAQDLEGNTPLMIAIMKERFDYALIIARKMSEEPQLHKAFAFTNNISKKTALGLMQGNKDKFAHKEEFSQLYSILEKHEKMVW